MGKEIRDSVNEFYSSAAVRPVESLCCAASYREEDVSHIPKEVLDISYGCGSPVALADLKEGETLVDLGSGGGIDCFIAAKMVGRNGRVYGVDMTEEMLLNAREASSKVASNLGYDIVEFKRGFLEDIPIGNETADVVTSNCVINLSPDKERVLKEICRVLKHGGRFCISDIVSEKEVPEDMRADKKLWGECLSGAMKEDEFMNAARGAGFYGLHILTKSLYREIEDIRFYSITLRGYKFKKGKECVYAGHFAVYNGPFKSVRDDDGHEYPVGQPVEVCTDTVEKLKMPPYAGHFTITDPEDSMKETVGCTPGKCC
ncbi:MAG: methyltransferase domain-containing protein [Deltaproteobacteria bacterium]|nr:methyltransferase domain-containing protein [Deltaproteobacteria bacterium]